MEYEEMHTTVPELEEEGVVMEGEVSSEEEEYSLKGRTAPTILCCLCGTEIESNPANMCIDCLRMQVDITDGITKEAVLSQCRNCDRYFRSPSWVRAELESPELLALCLKKISGLNKVKLVDAGFIWTEPHSKRLKVKLRVQKEVLSGVKLEQVFITEMKIQNQQCDDCQRSFTEHTWKAVVQVRQKVPHKKTFFLLEQLILKYEAHTEMSNIDQVPSGMDFYFLERSKAVKFVDFLFSVVPVRYKTSKQLISHDMQSNVFNYKYSFAVDIVPLCKDDLVVLPPKLASSLGNISPLTLVYRVSNYVYLVSPETLQTAELNGERFWKHPHRALLSASRMIEYVVLDLTPVNVERTIGTKKKAKKQAEKQREIQMEAADQWEESGSRRTAKKGKKGRRQRRRAKPTDVDSDDDDAASTVAVSTTKTGRSRKTHAPSTVISQVRGKTLISTIAGGPRGKFMLAEATVARACDLGVNDTMFTVTTHLGNVLKVGDSVMGYDLTHAVYNEMDADTTEVVGKGKELKSKLSYLPDAVLVKKVYPKTKKVKKRSWKLNRMAVDSIEHRRKADEEREQKEYEEFLEEIEEDKFLRKRIEVVADGEEEKSEERSTKVKFAPGPMAGIQEGDEHEEEAKEEDNDLQEEGVGAEDNSCEDIALDDPHAAPDAEK